MNMACNTNRENKIAYRILVGKPEGKRPLRRPRRKWLDGWSGIDWIDLIQDRDRWRAVLNTAIDLRVL
jgi:hypothetical protein